MKQIFLLIIFHVAVVNVAAAQNTVKSTIKVYGNCEMCKSRIERALEHKGIVQASWDTETKNLEVTYDSKELSEEKIHKLIAAVGHDTDKVKATDEVYNKLPGCCQYRVDDSKAKGHHH